MGWAFVFSLYDILQKNDGGRMSGLICLMKFSKVTNIKIHWSNR